MGWFRVDDTLSAHDKVAQLDTDYPWEIASLATSLWVRAGADCAHKRDGRVTLARALRLVTADRDATVTAVTALVSCGLWEECAEGYLFTNWDRYNGDEGARKAADAERQQRSRDRKRTSYDETSRSSVTPVTDPSRTRHASAPQLHPNTPQEKPFARSSALALQPYGNEPTGQKERPREIQKLDSPTEPPSPPAPMPIAAPRTDQVRREYEDRNATMDMVAKSFSEARRAAGGGPISSSQQRSLYDPLLSAVQLFREAAQDAGVEPVELMRTSAANFCTDQWAAEAGWPIQAWLKDPGKYLTKPTTTADLTKQLKELEQKARTAYDADERGDFDRYTAQYNATKAQLEKSVRKRS